VTVPVISTGVPFDMAGAGLQARSYGGAQPNYPHPWGPGIPTPSNDPPATLTAPKHPWGPGIPQDDPYATSEGPAASSAALGKHTWGPGLFHHVPSAKYRRPSASSAAPKHHWGPGVPHVDPHAALVMKIRQADSISSEPSMTMSTSTPTPTMPSNQNNDNGRIVMLGWGGALTFVIVVSLLGTLYFRCRRGPSKKSVEDGDVEMEIGAASKQPESARPT